MRVARSTLRQWEVECSFDLVVQIAKFDLRCLTHGYLWFHVSEELHENARLSLAESILHASGLIPGQEVGVRVFIRQTQTDSLSV